MNLNINVDLNTEEILQKAKDQIGANRVSKSQDKRQQYVEKEAVDRVSGKKGANGEIPSLSTYNQIQRDTSTSSNLSRFIDENGRRIGDSVPPYQNKRRVAANPVNPLGSKIFCMSVVDENDNDTFGILEYWDEWLTYYQQGHFALLQPAPFASALGLPALVSGYEKFSFSQVGRPGEGGPATNWWDIVGETIIANEYKYISLSVDNSGSMTTETVSQSLNTFVSQAESNGCEFIPYSLQQTGNKWSSMPSENYVRGHINTYLTLIADYPEFLINNGYEVTV